MPKPSVWKNRSGTSKPIAGWITGFKTVPNDIISKGNTEITYFKVWLGSILGHMNP